MKTRGYIAALAAGLCLALCLSGCMGRDHDVIPSDYMDPKDLPALADMAAVDSASATEAFRGIPRNALRQAWGEADGSVDGMDVYVYNDTGITIAYDASYGVSSIEIGPAEILTDALPTPAVYEKYDHQPDVAPSTVPPPGPSEDLSWIDGVVGITPSPEPAGDGTGQEPSPEPSPEPSEEGGAENSDDLGGADGSGGTEAGSA